MRVRAKKVLSTAAASALVAAQMVMPAMAADGGEIEVDVTTKTAVIRVVVPTDLTIAVDQFEMGDTGTQIKSSEFTMVNNSEVPVKIDVTSEAVLGGGITLAATKEGAKNASTSQAWLAVAAQTAAGAYDDAATDSTTETIGTLTEANANVTTFAATGSKAAQTFYLAAPANSATMEHKLLVPSTAKNNEGVTYAQFYALTELATQPINDATLKDAVEDADIYVVTTTEKDDNEASVTKIDKGDTTATWATGNTYYTAADVATAIDDLAASGHYVYSGMDTDGGKAAFRYIGQLAESKEVWSDDDITTVKVKYSIYGVTASNYEAVEDDCTYGLYAAASTTPESDGTTAVSIKFTGSKPAAGAISIKAPGTAAAFTPQANQYPSNIEITETDIVIKANWLNLWKTTDGWGTGEYTVTAGGQTYKFTLK